MSIGLKYESRPRGGGQRDVLSGDFQNVVVDRWRLSTLLVTVLWAICEQMGNRLAPDHQYWRHVLWTGWKWV